MVSLTSLPAPSSCSCSFGTWGVWTMPRLDYRAANTRIRDRVRRLRRGRRLLKPVLIMRKGGWRLSSLQCPTRKRVEILVSVGFIQVSSRFIMLPNGLSSSTSLIHNTILSFWLSVLSGFTSLIPFRVSLRFDLSSWCSIIICTWILVTKSFILDSSVLIFYFESCIYAFLCSNNAHVRTLFNHISKPSIYLVQIGSPAGCTEKISS